MVRTLLGTTHPRLLGTRVGLPHLFMARKETERVCCVFCLALTVEYPNLLNHRETSYAPRGGPAPNFPLEEFIPPNVPGYRPAYIQGPTYLHADSDKLKVKN